MSKPFQLDTESLKASIERILAEVGESDRKLIDEVAQLRDVHAATTEAKRSYEDAIKALQKSAKQKAVPVRRKIAEALVAFASQLELPLGVTDRPARRRSRQPERSKGVNEAKTTSD